MHACQDSCLGLGLGPELDLRSRAAAGHCRVLRRLGAPGALVAALIGLGAPAAGVAGPAAEQELVSCVEGSPPMRVSSAAERAALDATDRQRFHDAAAARYPLYQRSGLLPAHVLLLRRGGGWQYVTLWRRESAGLCFAAVFTAEKFDFTDQWLRKYRPRPAEAAD